MQITRDQMQLVMETVFDECRSLRQAGQKEYAHDPDNAFANFEDDAKALGISREAVLTIFANKHWRGVRAWVKGHRSQRENVRGRINDLIVYLCLLRGMIDEADGGIADIILDGGAADDGNASWSADQIELMRPLLGPQP